MTHGQPGRDNDDPHPDIPAVRLSGVPKDFGGLLTAQGNGWL